jgi:dTDP-glucose 4,6-dehydratase
MCHIMHGTDWELIGIDSFRHKGMTDRVEEMLADHPDWRPRIKIYTHDLTAPISDLLAKKIGKIDYIINMASLSDVFGSIKDPAPFVLSNVQLMLTMVEYARANPPKAFLQISTDEVYGPTDGVHAHAEWDPIVPSNPYSASKVAQEAIAISYWRTYGLPLIIVNLMNNFGEMQSAAKFPAIIQRKVAAGERVTIHGNAQSVGSRHYIHSRNSADAFLFLLQKTAPHKHQDGSVDKPDRYNIVGDKQVSNIDLVMFIGACMNKKATYILEDFKVTRPGHDSHYGLDGAKMATLGWKSPVSFEQSMAETVRWTQAHPEWLEPHG